MKQTTIIIPVRLTEDRLYDDIERMERICETVPAEYFDILVSDFGTPQGRLEDFKRLERFSNVRVVTTGAQADIFSIGIARDEGVRAARTPVIMFHDIDFLCERAGYLSIHAEIESRGLAGNAYDFFTVPTVYLNQRGTVEYLDRFMTSDLAMADRMVHSHGMKANGDFVEHVALGSSALVCNRYLYLMTGGHDRAFRGHGAEDFEFYNRLSEFVPFFKRPPHYTHNGPARTTEWKGFRSYFSLFGMEVWMRGMMLVHLHHPRREASSDDYAKTRQNFAYLAKKLDSHQGYHNFQFPLSEPKVEARTLVLVDIRSKPGTALLGVYPALGECITLKETDFDSAADVLSYVEAEGVTQVLLLNPYGNPHRQAIYQALKAARIRTLAYDRGAFPDSWFFDDGGFLGESRSYLPEAWDRPLSEEERARTLAEIDTIVGGNRTLEANGDRLGPSYWQNELGTRNRKVILVVMQRPKDTATVYFSGPCQSAAGFNEWVQHLADTIDRARYVVVVKKHPLETERPVLNNVVFAPDDANIYDLTELADKVVAINSGSGLLAMAMNKPVVICGKAFYQHDGMGVQALSKEHLCQVVTEPFTPDYEKILRFVHYLAFRFYSYGAARYATVNAGNGATLRIAYRIDFSVIRHVCAEEIRLGDVKPLLTEDSFVLRGVQKFAEGGNAPAARQPAPAPAAAPAPAGGNAVSPQKILGRLAETYHAPSRLDAFLMMRKIRNSGEFDEAWYLGAYPDVAEARGSAIKHFVYHGCREGRNPSASFNTLEYYRQHPQLVEAGVNALIHKLGHPV